METESLTHLTEWSYTLGDLGNIAIQDAIFVNGEVRTYQEIHLKRRIYHVYAQCTEALNKFDKIRTKNEILKYPELRSSVNVVMYENLASSTRFKDIFLKLRDCGLRLLHPSEHIDHVLFFLKGIPGFPFIFPLETPLQILDGGQDLPRLGRRAEIRKSNSSLSLTENKTQNQLTKRKEGSSESPNKSKKRIEREKASTAEFKEDEGRRRSTRDLTRDITKLIDMGTEFSDLVPELSRTYEEKLVIATIHTSLDWILEKYK